MSGADLKNSTVTRRLDRVMRRERLRTILKIAGIALLIVGIAMAIFPFGAPVSNPVMIPKADPQAGIALIQALPLGSTRQMGVTIALAGVVSLVLFALLGTGKSRNDANRKL
jgi:ABC-type cobalamin transport system permease subunit